MQRDIKKHNLLKEQNEKLIYYTQKNLLPKDIKDKKSQGIYNDNNLYFDLGKIINYIKKRNMRKKVTFEDFLERAKKAHPDEKYFYYEHTYDGITKKVKIKCLEHGDFWQFGTDHVRGQGCPICGIKKISGQTKLY